MIGEVINGRYLVQRSVGTGSTGEVFVARHTGLGREYAVKILFGTLSSQRMFAARFQREAKALARLEHPNIVRIFDSGALPDGRLYLVMDYVEGERLDALLHRSGELSVSRALRIVRQIAAAIEHAHQAGVLHRDLRPANLLLAQPNAGEEVKVLDFGISKILSPDYRESKVVSKEYAGVDVLPHYKAPEQLRFVAVDHACDVYAIGCILYELLTGWRPFTGTSAEIIVGHLSQAPQRPSSRRGSGAISPALDALVLRCLEKDPKQRLASGRELGMALDRMEARYPSPIRKSRAPLEPAAAAAEQSPSEPPLEEIVKPLVSLLLDADGDHTQLLAAQLALREGELSRELITHELELARQRRNYLDGWSQRSEKELGAPVREPQFLRRCARLDEDILDLQEEMKRAESTIAGRHEALAALVETLIPQLKPSGDSFLLIRRWQRARARRST
jgi:serine/threonine-protein kinase